MFNIIISFIPWSIYSWVVNENVLTLVGRSLILTVILLFIIVVNIKIFRQGEPVMITNILTVIVLFVNYFAGWSTLLLNYSTSFCYLSLALVSLISLLVKKPFTVFYASAGVSEEKRRHIMFYLINKYITWIWVIIFFANGLLNAFFAWTPQLRLATIGLVWSGLVWSGLVWSGLVWSVSVSFFLNIFPTSCDTFIASNTMVHNMSLLNILTGTPLWVWILLFFLIGRGINALNDREMEVKRLFLLPLIFLFWGGSGVINELAFPRWGGISMLVGLIIGGSVGWLLWRATPRLKIKEGTDLIIRPGTPLTLIFIIIAFSTKFTLIFFLNVEPDLKYVFNFNLVFGLLSGIIDGVFWGGILNLYITFRKNAN